MLFGGREAVDLDVRGFAHEHENAFLAELTQTLKVDGLAVDRRVVDLEVAGMDDAADGRVDAERVGVCDRVVNSDEFDGECVAEADDVAVLSCGELQAFHRDVLVLEL